MNYKTEADIRRAGGTIEEIYRGLQRYLDRIDSYALAPLNALGMASDKEEYLYLSHQLSIDLRRFYVRKIVNKMAVKVEEAVKMADSEGKEYTDFPVITKYAKSTTGANKGKIFAEEILHDGEKLRKKITKKFAQKLNVKYSKILKDCNTISWNRWDRIIKHDAEDIYFEAIKFSPEEGLTIDIPTFAEIYRSRIEAQKSEIYKQHEAAAAAFNAFFRNIEITEKEISRYFDIYGGKLRPNPSSVNLDSYMRLKW